MKTTAVNAEAAAEALGVSASHLRALAAERRIPHLAIPGTGGKRRYRFCLDELEQFFRVEPENVAVQHHKLVQPPRRPHRRVADREPDWDSIGK